MDDRFVQRLCVSFEEDLHRSNCCLEAERDSAKTWEGLYHDVNSELEALKVQVQDQKTIIEGFQRRAKERL